MKNRYSPYFKSVPLFLQKNIHYPYKVSFENLRPPFIKGGREAGGVGGGVQTMDLYIKMNIHSYPLPTTIKNKRVLVLAKMTECWAIIL